ncbi:hypothetical protein SAMN05421767_10129 [Granulicatella balaenopterae]|uniref:Short-chain dehydrogenase n=1 Tax=Granulicatella balaenopterae TaxID=137733 RepID=A0A1H9GRU5_9LACT|nr:SDR family oxidoreductase [Granulicatella balaenopterae]SEQ52836.1 hypothetical protein SAMN05421767_10129 [Granulicatella balaenopterae]
MRKQLSNKTAVITGASGGLGEQFAYQLAQKNMNVILIARNLEKLTRIKEKCKAMTNGKVIVFSCDLTDSCERKKVIDELVKMGDIDVLINNAGFGLFKEAVDFSEEEIRVMFELNVAALMDLTINLVPQMKERGGGTIVQIASQAGKMATNKSSIYSATKFAVLGFTNALRLELKKDKINVISVNPGPIETNFFNVADASGKYLESVGAIVLSPEKVAKKVIRAIETGKREVNLPKIMNVGSKVYTLCPHFGDWVTLHLFNKK